MTTFAQSAASFIESRPNAVARGGAWSAFLVEGLPTTSDEVWRYSPLSEFDLDRYAVPEGPATRPDSTFASQLCARAGTVVRVVDGFVANADSPADGVTVHVEESNDWDASRYEHDSFALLNLALAPGTTVITIPAGVHVERPIVIVHSAYATASLPRTKVVVQRDASATVVEYFEGGSDSMVVPVSEYDVDENASLQLITYQRLASSAWHVARTTGFVARDARLRQSVIGMGAGYDRSRNDAVLRGVGAENELRTTFMGSGSQVHDFRTHQFHVGARSRSTLLSKGAVADESRCVYTGLIEIEKGAKRTDARQTNHNLLLSRGAHADSVPNLDIRENDVVCAHASSVGPLDELQLWYLESRGIERAAAERLMIQGFFYEMLAPLPADIAELVERDVTMTLADIAVGRP